MNRKVRYARLQTGMYIPGLTGELGNVLPPNNKTLDNLEMTLVDSWLHVTFAYKGIKKELAIPSTNVILADLVPENTNPPLKVLSAS